MYVVRALRVESIKSTFSKPHHTPTRQSTISTLFKYIIAQTQVLHRNELRGALSGLTRVRRFQQDDAHIFCRVDQVEEEIVGALEFMKYVYDIFGMTYIL